MRRGTLQQSKIANLILNITLENIFVLFRKISFSQRLAQDRLRAAVERLERLASVERLNHFYCLLPLASCLIH